MQREDVYTDSPPAPPGGEPLRRPRGGGFPFLSLSPRLLAHSRFIIIEQKRMANCDFFFHGVGREMDVFIL